MKLPHFDILNLVIEWMCEVDLKVFSCSFETWNEYDFMSFVKFITYIVRSNAAYLLTIPLISIGFYQLFSIHNSYTT